MPPTPANLALGVQTQSHTLARLVPGSLWLELEQAALACQFPLVTTPLLLVLPAMLETNAQLASIAPQARHEQQPRLAQKKLFEA